MGSNGRGANGRAAAERRGTGGWESVLEAERTLEPGSEWHSELYRVAVDQFRRAADLLGLEDEMRARLLEPRRSLVVNFPVRLDDGEVAVVHRLPRPAHADDGPDEGRLPLRARASRSASARRSRCG